MGSSVNVQEVDLGLQKLPTELILQVVEALLPTASSDLIFDPVCPEGHALVSFTLACRATYSLATRLLREHCIYVGSSDRLRRLLLSLTASQSPVVSTLPLTLPLKKIRSMYLSPFPGTLDDQPTAIWTRELCGEVGGTLTRLVVNVPIADLDIHDDHLDVHKILDEGFDMLGKLEELVDLSWTPHLILPNWNNHLQDLNLKPRKTWPLLRRMACPFCYFPWDDLWGQFAAQKHLDTLVLIAWDWADIESAIRLDESMLIEYMTKRSEEAKQKVGDPLFGGRAFKMAVAHAEMPPNGAPEGNRSIFADSEGPVELVSVPVYAVHDAPDDEKGEIVRPWVKAAALQCDRGLDAVGKLRDFVGPRSLWDWNRW